MELDHSSAEVLCVVSLCCKIVGKVVRLISCCILLLCKISRGDPQRCDWVSQVASWQYSRGIRLSSRLCDLLDLGLVGRATLGLLVLEFGHLVVVVVIVTLVAHATHAAHH